MFYGEWVVFGCSKDFNQLDNIKDTRSGSQGFIDQIKYRDM